MSENINADNDCRHFSAEEMTKTENTRGLRIWALLVCSSWVMLLTALTQINAVKLSFFLEQFWHLEELFSSLIHRKTPVLKTAFHRRYELIGCWNKWRALRSKTGLWWLDKLSCRQESLWISGSNWTFLNMAEEFFMFKTTYRNNDNNKRMLFVYHKA